jgi:transcriptional regulator with XRE-family HTH domain
MTLEHLLKTLGTQEQAAERIGVAQTTVSAWLTGRALPRRLAIRALSQATERPEEEVRRIIEAERSSRAASPTPASVGPVAEGA